MTAEDRTESEERARPGRHRRSGAPLIRRREHGPRRPRRRLPIPAPSPSALVGIAVLVLIGIGAIHLSGSGTAVPVRQEPTTAVDTAGAVGADTGAGAAPTDPPTGTVDPTEDGAGTEESTSSSELVVHVSGAVARPGVVRLPDGARVADALQAAGGAEQEAELAAINLARPLGDGEQVHVPLPGEEVPEPPDPATDAADGGTSAGSVIDLNTAGAAELEELPGVGPAIAGRIIEHRELNGQFESVEQLLEVSGIGPATLADLRDRATV